MFSVFNDIEKVKKKWPSVASVFMNYEFINCYVKKNLKTEHIFFIYKNELLVYAHFFKLRFNKAKNYLNKFLFSSTLLKLLNIRVLYLNNSYITNVPSFFSKDKIDIDHLLQSFNKAYSIAIIPDFLLNKSKYSKLDLLKIDVEEEMILSIRENWNSFNDYIDSLKTKYRKKVNKIFQETKSISVINLNEHDILKLKCEMQSLFDQVVAKSSFNGPNFEILTLSSLVKNNFAKVNGYYQDEKLIGFSSEIESNDCLYSYFVGFDTDLNKSVPIYGRILLENILNAINLKKKELLLGRTANEFKSNFGAEPKQSTVYIHVKNKFLRYVISFIVKRLRLNVWIKRSPFKK